MSVCHISLGRSASKRISECSGRFCGWATISPSRLRTRQIVEGEGTAELGARCSAIVWAPQS